MRKNDIRFSKRAATIEHHSARGEVIRNAGNFTRGSQLVSHEMMMMTWLITPGVVMSLIAIFYFEEHELQLILMKAYAEAWDWVDFNPTKAVNLTLPDGSVTLGQMAWVPFHPVVELGWSNALRLMFAAGIGSVFLCQPLDKPSEAEIERPNPEHNQNVNEVPIPPVAKVEAVPNLPAEASSIAPMMTLPNSSAFRVGPSKNSSDNEGDRDPDRVISSTQADAKSSSTRSDISKSVQQPSKSPQESLIVREQREGIGTEEQQKDGPDIENDFEAEM